VNRAFPIRQALAVLLAMPALYLTFVLYQSGNALVALILLVGTCLGLFIYLSPAASTYRYLFPGFVGFGLFVIFPILYTVYISFTKYSSENLLFFDRAAAIFRNETFVSANAASYKYRLYVQDDGTYVLYLEDQKDPAKRFASEPFELSVGAKSKGPTEPVKLGALPGGRRGQRQTPRNASDRARETTRSASRAPVCASRRDDLGTGRSAIL